MPPNADDGLKYHPDIQIGRCSTFLNIIIISLFCELTNVKPVFERVDGKHIFNAGIRIQEI